MKYTLGKLEKLIEEYLQQFDPDEDSFGYDPRNQWDAATGELHRFLVWLEERQTATEREK